MWRQCCRGYLPNGTLPDGKRFLVLEWLRWVPAEDVLSDHAEVAAHAFRRAVEMFHKTKLLFHGDLEWRNALCDIKVKKRLM